jgi:type I restriction enzyme, R subunit
MLVEAANSAPEHIAKAREHGLGLFVRSLIGLERDAAKQAFAEFLSAGRSGRTRSSSSISLSII